MKRYGMDALSYTLLGISLVFCVSPYTVCITGALWAYVLFRALSKNMYDRSRENQRLVNMFKKLPGKEGARAARAENRRDTKRYRYFSCPHCARRMRAPVGKGKIAVRCAGCGQSFHRHT